MATYKIIESITLTTNQSTVTFSNIPQTYRHLILHCFARTNLTGDSGQYLRLNINGSTGLSNAWFEIYGQGSGGLGASKVTSTTYGGMIGYADAASATASTFSNNTVFIPHYAMSPRTKVSYAFGGNENNASMAVLKTVFNRHDTTSSVTSLSIQGNWGNTAPTNSLVANSVFTLYGLANN